MLNEIKIDTGVSTFELDEKTKETLKKMSQLKEQHPELCTQELVGAIEEEYSCSENEIEYISSKIIPLIQQTNYYKHVFGNAKEIRVQNMWWNYQKRYEYQAPHTHSGDMSFVIWLNMPYDIENERKEGLSSKSLRFMDCKFAFMFPNNYRQSFPIEFELDKSDEGCGVIFPSSMTHFVTPFSTCDGERVSISGNFNIN